MVSHACIFLTKLFLSINFLIENAKLKVTANGKPSGIATTMIETHKINIFKNLLIISINFIFSLFEKYSKTN